ncbi:MAG: heavy metal translocating P-type ATPase metal-binding domain-containing protein [Acidobacteriota bacterium]|nr:heavy metal translocating P-type ATPase metal-binding domain-containing protein [Acidobacteriota bacterium]
MSLAAPELRATCPLPSMPEAAPPPSGEAPRPDACAHCGLPLGAYWRAEDGPFCCRGCRTVYQLIHDQGFERYYDLRRRPTAPPAQLRRDSLNWLDSVLEQAPELPGSNLRRLRLDLQGVHCAACIWLLEKLFARHAGAGQLRINPAVGSVDMLWDPSQSDLRDYLHEVESFGYRFGPPRKAAPRRSRGLLIRIGICAAASMNVMTYSLAYYLGLAADETSLFELLGQLSLGWAVLALAVGGSPFILSAWRGLRRGIAHLDLPIATGMVLAFAGSTWAYLAHGPHAAYFDTITIFVTLMLVGRWLQERVVERNRNALLASAGIADLFTRRFDGGMPEAIPVSAIEAGDELWIAPGDLVPVASILLHRAATVSLDWITGEAAAVETHPGDVVPAGAFNAGSRGFRITAREDFSGSRLTDLIRGDLITSDEGEPKASSAPAGGVEAWWNRVASVYVLLVFAVAAVGFLVGLRGGLQLAVETSVAILVVTCPCALGLGLPLGRELAHGRLRDLGVLLRDDGFLDRALALRKVVFDKTGTITRGQLRLSRASVEALKGLEPAHRAVLRSMVARSNHPVSRCVAEALAFRESADAALASADAGSSVSADDLREVTGQGLTWRGAAGEYRFGRPDFVLGQGNSGLGEPMAPSDDNFPGAVLGLDGEALAALEFEEDLRPDASSEVEALQDLGLAVYLFSGDTSSKVARVADELQLPRERVQGDLSPEQKAAAVAALDEHDTLMVGDGLNDSPSFDAAYCKATPAVDRAILPQKADFYFLGDGIGAVRHAIEMARHLHRVQRGNLLFAAVYNLAAVSLCFAGVVDPVVAAILMPASSVAVVLLTSHRLARRTLRWTS